MHDAHLFRAAAKLLLLLIGSCLFVALFRTYQPSTSSHKADSSAVLHLEESRRVNRRLTNASDDDNWFQPNRSLGCKTLQMPTVLCSVILGAKQQAIDNLIANMKALGPQVSVQYCIARIYCNEVYTVPIERLYRTRQVAEGY
jgi:hypothetical protein